MAGYKVVTDALREEAKLWRDRSDRTLPIVEAVRNTYLTTSSFFVGDPKTLATQWVNADILAAEYEECRAFVEKILNAAATEFEQISIVLRRIADDYEEAEEVTEIDLNQAYHI